MHSCFNYEKFMPLTSEQIIKKASKRFPKFYSEFMEIQNQCTEVVFFGSFAYGCENKQSDIDVLFVGKGTRRVSKSLDFIWVNPKRLESKSWLCSEIAIHIANSGVWYKGNGEWRKNVFFNKSSITRKKQLILNRCIHLLLNKDTLNYKRKITILQKILLNSYRLIALQNNIPNTQTYFTVNEMASNFTNFTEHIFDEKMLGNVGKILFEEIFLSHPEKDYLGDSLKELTKRYELTEQFN